MTDTEVRSDTREELIRSAERLFATRGIDGVSLREITRAAGQRNTSALQYHFGDRRSLLQAVIDKHRADTEPRRHALLDQWEAESSGDLRALAAALVLPLAAKLDDPDGGRAYLQINCEVYTRPSAQIELVPRRDPGNSMLRWHAMLDPMLPEEERKALHSRFPAIRLAFVELARRAESPPGRDDRLFTSHLTDLITALLTSRPSGPTLRLLELRTGRRPAGLPGTARRGRSSGSAWFSPPAPPCVEARGEAHRGHRALRPVAGSGGGSLANCDLTVAPRLHARAQRRNTRCTFTVTTRRSAASRQKG